MTSANRHRKSDYNSFHGEQWADFESFEVNARRDAASSALKEIVREIRWTERFLLSLLSYSSSFAFPFFLSLPFLPLLVSFHSGVRSSIRQGIIRRMIRRWSDSENSAAQAVASEICRR